MNVPAICSAIQILENPRSGLMGEVSWFDLVCRGAAQDFYFVKLEVSSTAPTTAFFPNTSDSSQIRHVGLNFTCHILRSAQQPCLECACGRGYGTHYAGEESSSERCLQYYRWLFITFWTWPKATQGISLKKMSSVIKSDTALQNFMSTSTVHWTPYYTQIIDCKMKV